MIHRSVFSGLKTLVIKRKLKMVRFISLTENVWQYLNNISERLSESLIMIDPFSSTYLDSTDLLIRHKF